MDCKDLAEKFTSNHEGSSVACEFFDLHAEENVMWIEPFHCEHFEMEKCNWTHHYKNGKTEENQHDCEELVEKLYHNGVQIAHDCFHFNVDYHERGNSFEVDPATCVYTAGEGSRTCTYVEMHLSGAEMWREDWECSYLDYEVELYGYEGSDYKECSYEVHAYPATDGTYDYDLVTLCDRSVDPIILEPVERPEHNCEWTIIEKGEKRTEKIDCDELNKVAEEHIPDAKRDPQCLYAYAMNKDTGDMTYEEVACWSIEPMEPIVEPMDPACFWTVVDEKGTNTVEVDCKHLAEMVEMYFGSEQNPQCYYDYTYYAAFNEMGREEHCPEVMPEPQLCLYTQLVDDMAFKKEVDCMSLHVELKEQGVHLPDDCYYELWLVDGLWEVFSDEGCGEPDHEEDVIEEEEPSKEWHHYLRDQHFLDELKLAVKEAKHYLKVEGMEMNMPQREGV